MNKIIKINRGVLPALLAVVMVLGSLLPAIVPTAGAASFNDSGSPYRLVRGSNYTEDPGCSTCWEDALSVDAGDVVSIRVLVHNDSSEEATDVKVKITPNVHSDGKSVIFTGTVSADNASPESQTVKVTLNSGEINEIDHVTSFVGDGFGNAKSFSGSASDIVGSGGLSIGDVNAGLENLRWVVARFTIEGDGGNDDNDNGDGPEVTTRNADDVDDNSAELVCDVEAGDEDTDVWFEWSEDDDDLDDDTSKVSVDAGDDDTVTKIITGLDGDTKYFFRCTAEDDDGNEDTGTIKNFTTGDGDDGDDDTGAPDVTTISATGVNSTSATLRCEVNPNGDDTDVWFQWGTSSSNLNRATSRQDVGDGNSDVSCSANISGLSENTTYFFRAVAENGEGDDEGSILNFRTGSPIVNVVTRFVDIFRNVEVVQEEEPEVEALIITLNADAINADSREIDYTVSYDNRTGLTLTDVVLTVPMPNELNFIGSDPRESLNRDDELVFNIGTVRPREQDSFLIETELANGVDANDQIRFVANVGYNDNSSVRKIVEVIDESTFGELFSGGGAFTAAIADAFRGLFTNPLLWIILFILLITFAVRYMFSAREKRTNVLV